METGSEAHHIIRRSLQLAGGSTEASLSLSTSDFHGVILAGQDLSVDFGRITGKNLTVVNQNLKSADTSPTSGPVVTLASQL